MIKFKIQGGYNMNKTPDNTEQNIEEYIDPTYHQIMELWKLLTSEQRELIVRNAYMLAKTNGDLD